MVQLDSHYGILVLSNGNHKFSYRRLAVTAVKNFQLSLITRRKVRIPYTDPFPGGDIFSKLNGSLLGSEGRLPPKMKLIGSIFV